MPPTDPPPPWRYGTAEQPAIAETPASAALGELVALLREFPEWAIWRTGNSEWSAARIPARGRPRSDQVLMWIHARNCQELRARIHAVDAEL